MTPRALVLPRVEEQSSTDAAQRLLAAALSRCEAAAGCPCHYPAGRATANVAACADCVLAVMMALSGLLLTLIPWLARFCVSVENVCCQSDCWAVMNQLGCAESVGLS